MQFIRCHRLSYALKPHYQFAACLSWHLAHAYDRQDPTWAAIGGAKQAEKGKPWGNIA